jgi:glycosyltransferase involved in cell wall biosynthesis
MIESPKRLRLLAYAPQMAAYGGMERHVCSLAAALGARGHQVDLMTTSNSLGSLLREELSVSKVALHELPLRRGAAGPGRKLLWLARKLWSLRRESWDVIYTNGQSALARQVWRVAGPKTRIVHHHHTSADSEEQKTWSSGFVKVLQQTRELVGCSQATCRELASAVGREDARFLPYLTQCPVDGEMLVDFARRADETLNFGFLGRMIPEKGIERILAISGAAELADVKWHLHGVGDAYPMSHFEKYHNVVYHGAYRGAQAHAEVLLGLDAMVLFSTHNEGMPLSLIEGMSAGLPWLATDRGGTKEIAIEPKEAMVLDSATDDSGLICAVRAMADRIRNGLTSRSRQRSAYDSHFSPQRVTAQWISFLEQS